MGRQTGNFNMPFGYPDIFIPLPIQTEVNEDEVKRSFGIELAKDHKNAFEAALVVFPKSTQKAMWASLNWINDPIVIASRDAYKETKKSVSAILDKEELAAKVLKIAEEKNTDGTRYLVEAKERINALKLYAEIAGYTGKVEIDASTKNFTNNQMTIKFVKADTKEPQIKTIEAKPNNTLENSNEEKSDLKIKLVKAVGA